LGGHDAPPISRRRSAVLRPIVDHDEQVVDVDRAIPVEVGVARRAGRRTWAPGVDDVEQIVDVDDAVAVDVAQLARGAAGRSGALERAAFARAGARGRHVTAIGALLEAARAQAGRFADGVVALI